MGVKRDTEKWYDHAVAKETPNHAVGDLARRNIHTRENGFERDIRTITF